jgi:3-phenylpropionate/trans-cinnamate dioxygenase ferredoxin subunit
MRNCAISCPVHGARFSLETGEALDLPATKPIPTYDVRVVDGWIEVRL